MWELVRFPKIGSQIMNPIKIVYEICVIKHVAIKVAK